MDEAPEGFFFGRLFKKLKKAVHPNRRPNRHQKSIDYKEYTYKHITVKKAFVINNFCQPKETKKPRNSK